jgi:hypothetical protein
VIKNLNDSVITSIRVFITVALSVSIFVPDVRLLCIGKRLLLQKFWIELQGHVVSFPKQLMKP